MMKSALYKVSSPLVSSINRRICYPASASSLSYSISPLFTSWHLQQQQQRWSTSAEANEEDDGMTEENKPINAFAVLDVDQKYDVDPKDLKSKYRKLMAQHHPDILGGKVDDKNTASIITHAYQQLANPHKRALHLLELLGNSQVESSTTLTEAGGSILDMDFLKQVMEIREEVDFILLSHQGEEEDADKALKPLWEENLNKIEHVCKELSDAFEAGNLEQALQLAGKLQYWNKIDETIREKLNDLE